MCHNTVVILFQQDIARSFKRKYFYFRQITLTGSPSYTEHISVCTNSILITLLSGVEEKASNGDMVEEEFTSHCTDLFSRCFSWSGGHDIVCCLWCWPRLDFQLVASPLFSVSTDSNYSSSPMHFFLRAPQGFVSRFLLRFPWLKSTNSNFIEGLLSIPNVHSHCLLLTTNFFVVYFLCTFVLKKDVQAMDAVQKIFYKDETRTENFYLSMCN